MSLAKNFVYNLFNQILTIIMPLITMPYISRVLGSNGVGINAYTYSIIQYFILLSTIGTSLYASREIAYVRDSKTNLSVTFWSIVSLKGITTVISYLCFLIFLLLIRNHQNILLIQSIYILAVTLDISWLYVGLEDFKKLVVRNLILKIIGVICIFLLVKTSNDLWEYVLILALSQLLGNLSLWFYLPQIINKVKVRWQDIKRHLLPSINLFIPQIAIQIYIVLNKTMLGVLSNTHEVGYFDNADKIVKLVLAIVTTLGTVMLPRISNTFARGDIKKVKDYLYNSFDFASYLSIPLMFGLAGISIKFAPWFFGQEFNKTGILISLVSPIIVFIAWSDVIGNQYLMSTGKIKGYTVSVTLGAIVNLLFNLILIGPYKSVGTAISTLIAEFSVILVQIYLIRNELKIKKLFHSVWKYILSSIMMYFIIWWIGIKFSTGIASTVMQIIIGMLSYFIFLFLLKSNINKILFQTVLKHLPHLKKV